MNNFLINHCSIRSGITLRKNTSSPAPHSETYLLRIKDIDSLEISPDYSSPVSINASTAKYLVNPGDTLFSSRGKTCKASVMPEHTGTFLAPSQLYIITPNDPAVLLPEFLALYLSSHKAEQFFKTKRKGSLVQIITKKSLSELPFTLPSIEEQKNIIALHKLADTETKIQYRISQKRTIQIQQALKLTQ